jgi:hypothetical protein
MSPLLTEGSLLAIKLPDDIFDTYRPNVLAETGATALAAYELRTIAATVAAAIAS